MSAGRRGWATAILVSTVLVAVPPAVAQSRAPMDRAGLVVRVQRLEEEVARLRGRIEELEYALRRLEGRLARGVATAPLPPPAAVADDGGDGGTAAGEVPAPPASPTTTAATETPPPPVEPSPSPPPVTPVERAPAVAGGDGSASAPEGTADPEERYRRALELLENGRFDEAARAFAAFLEDHPDHSRAPDAAFWLAETHFFRQDYATAAQLYARNFRTYGPDAPRASDTLLKLGMALAAIGERERACRTFAELARRYPRAPAHIRQALARERAAQRCP